MTSALRIAEVAERVGISTATVRYYERIGVLPQPERADNGYRRYDEHAVERLEFVVRAKQLGCTLEEITDLVVAWDGGECGPIQDRLRGVVAAKRAAAHAEIGDLVALTAELGRAAVALELHRPVGRCDDGCGCITVASEPEPDPVPTPTDGVGVSEEQSDDVPIVCTLETDRVPTRLDDWRQVISTAVARTTIPGGVRLIFDDPVDIGEIARLAVAEQHCCRFLAFRITIDRSGASLEVTAPDDALDVVRAAFGATA